MSDQQANVLSSKLRDSNTSGPSQDVTIKFNNKLYESWNSAKDAFHKVKTRGSSNWATITAVDQPDGSFKLQCKCGQSCQLGNPSQFFKNHKCKPLGERASKSKHGGALS
jgi:hypothetical protein